MIKNRTCSCGIELTYDTVEHHEDTVWQRLEGFYLVHWYSCPMCETTMVEKLPLKDPELS